MISSSLHNQYWLVPQKYHPKKTKVHPSVLHLWPRFLELPGIAWNCLPSADDIFGDDPNTVYVRMNVSSEKFKGD
jgi:hypothetical protein